MIKLSISSRIAFYREDLISRKDVLSRYSSQTGIYKMASGSLY